MTLLAHALHRVPSASSETWSGSCSLLFDRAAGSRDCLQDASTIINYDIAREDAVRLRDLTAAHGRARLRDALSGMDPMSLYARWPRNLVLSSLARN